MTAFPTIAPDSIPWLTLDQMIEADRLAVEEFGIELLQMMEHAGSSLARLTNALAPAGPVTVLAGGGNNGGGGLCAARHLINLGREVEVVSASSRPGPAVEHHLATLREMGVTPVDELSGLPVVVDALVGYGLDGPLRGRAADLADAVRGSFIVSLDIPSGHGAPGCVLPAATLTLALPKARIRGLQPLYLADLGLPEALWFRMGIETGPIFEAGRILRIQL
jgi:NAD(P)H-hydrate epimerase